MDSSQRRASRIMLLTTPMPCWRFELPMTKTTPPWLLKQLNPQQKQAYLHDQGHALVIAGAGSGKTRVISHRVARLIAQGTPANAILMVTFTNKAAEEMRQRVEGLLVENPKDIKGLLAGTFHSLANRFLRRYAPMVDLQSNFTILDASDALDLLRIARTTVLDGGVDFEGRRFPDAGVISSLISKAFNCNQEIHQIIAKERPWLEAFTPQIESIAGQYQQRKRDNQVLDFDDLLDFWLLLLQRRHQNLPMAQNLQHVLVDEYQDSNHIQAEILNLLVKNKTSLMAVGDDSQSIYGWRGADYANILNFPQNFDSVVYPLEHNYRSTPEILALANHSIQQNPTPFEKNLRTQQAPAHIKPRLVYPLTVHEEADYMIGRIHVYQDQGASLGDMGMLYRNHHQAAVLQLRLAENQIPFEVRSGIRFFAQAHIKDMVAFLKALFNPFDEIAWLRILKMLPGIGVVSAHKIHQVFVRQGEVNITRENTDLLKAIPKKALRSWPDLARTFEALLVENQSPAEMMTCLRTSPFFRNHLVAAYDNPQERDTDLAYLSEFSSRYRSLERFLSQLSLADGAAVKKDLLPEEEEEERITLTTIHQAKGLEWQVVFLIGLSEGLFPHARCLEPQERLQEERRLFYVGITRCKRHLELGAPLTLHANGRMEVGKASRFVEELPQNLLEIHNLHSPTHAKEEGPLNPLTHPNSSLHAKW